MSTLPALLGGPAPTTDNPPWDTAGNLINDAAKEIGIATVGDPFASSNTNFVQLCGLLKSLGRDLWRLQQWNQLTKSYSFATVANTSTYSLPADFGYMISQTGWNRTNRLPLGGPVSAQEWEYLKARLVGVVFTVLFRPQNQQIALYPDTNTPGGYTIAFEYISRYWVQPLGQTTGTADKPSLSSDTILYDPQLVVRGLRRAFLRAKGFDSSAADEDFQMTLEQVRGEDCPSPIVSLNKSVDGDPLIGQQSIPVTGFGSS